MGNENSTFSFFRFVSGSKKAVARRVRNHLPPLHFLQYDMSTLQRRTCCPIELWLVDWGNIHHTHLGSFHPGVKRQALDLAPPRQDHGIVENGRVAGTSLGLTWRSWSFLGSSYQVGIRWNIRSTSRLVLRAVINHCPSDSPDWKLCGRLYRCEQRQHVNLLFFHFKHCPSSSNYSSSLQRLLRWGDFPTQLMVKLTKNGGLLNQGWDWSIYFPSLIYHHGLILHTPSFRGVSGPSSWEETSIKM